MTAAGTFVLVVGPSGAGKDSLIRAARDRFANDPGIIFPRRIITRPSSPDEECSTVDVRAFVRLVSENAFALHWGAHGLFYGLPATIHQDLAAGRIVVSNVSRRVVATVRASYHRVFVVEVTASEAVLAERLARRKRVDDGNLAVRLARSAPSGSSLDAELTIVNEGPLELSTAQLISALELLSNGSR